MIAAALVGCSSTGGLFGSADDAGRSFAVRDGSARLDADALGVYLELMRRLVEGDSVTQADAFADAADAVELAPTATNRLRHALALAVPGHAGSDAAAAERALSGLLADNTLLPAERALAEIHRAEVAQRLVLDASAERLRRALAAARAEQNASGAAALEAALAENRRLRAALDDALEKLEAITSIEQSIRERENEPELP